MDFPNLAQALHILDSDSAAPSVKRALHLNSDQILVNEDVVSCGPTPATDNLNSWRLIRERFLKDIYVQWPEFSFDAYSNNGLYMNLERFDQESTIIVWVARGLSEQLLLAWVVYLLDQLELDISKLRVIQFNNRRPRQQVLSIGELSPDSIRNYCPEPRHLRSEEVAELRRVWSVYTSNDPTNLARYVAEVSRMPLLYQAVSRLVCRYPDVQSGIGVWDERLLHYTMEKGPAAARVIGYTMGFSETLDQVGDSYLFHRLVALGSPDLTSPLISITGSARKMRECEVKLTAFGQKVLAGEDNHVQENGIDDWVGGVHLSAEGSVTFREGDSLVLPL